MITHEIQPNLALFEPSQITSSVFFFFFSPAELPGSPLLPSSLRIWRKVGGCLSSSSRRLSSQLVWTWHRARSQRSGSGQRHLPSTDEWLVDTDRNRESLRLIKTYTLSALCREFSQNPYVSLNFHSLLTLFKSLSREDVQSKVSSWGREAERSRVEPREEGGGSRGVADLLPQSVFRQGALIKGTQARLWHPEQTGWVCH